MWNIAWEKSFKIMYFTASFSSSLVQNEDEMVFAPYNYDAHKQIFILDLEFVSKVFKGLFLFFRC